MGADRLIDLLMDLASALDIVWREPASHAARLEVGIEAVGELLVFVAVADKAGVLIEARTGK